MAGDYGFCWKEPGEEQPVQQEPIRGRGHSDPTADAAIGHIIAEEKRERRRKERQHQKKRGPKKSDRPKTLVWRSTDGERGSK